MAIRIADTNEEVIDLEAIRGGLGFSQRQMAERMGMSERGYQKLENGETPVYVRHLKLASYVALETAVKQGNPMLAPAPVRRLALDLASLLRGE